MLDEDKMFGHSETQEGSLHPRSRFFTCQMDTLMRR